MDDPSPSCRRNVHRVLNGLALLPSGSVLIFHRPAGQASAQQLISRFSPVGADALLPLVPVLILKLRQEIEEEEVQVFLLSTLSCCSRLDALPALTSHGISLLSHKISHPSPNIRREAAAAMMVLRFKCSWFDCICCCQHFIAVLACTMFLYMNSCAGKCHTEFDSMDNIEVALCCWSQCSCGREARGV